MQGPERDRLLLIYSPLDTRWRDEFKRHLAPLEKAERIAEWLDQSGPRGPTADKIEAEVGRAQLVLLLVPRGFVAPLRPELSPLVPAARSAGVPVWWVPISTPFASSPSDEPWALAPGCDPARPLNALDTEDQRRAVAAICHAVLRKMGVPTAPDHSPLAAPPASPEPKRTDANRDYTLPPNLGRLTAHLSAALANAIALAGSGPMTGAHVLRGICGLAGKSSDAFTEIRSLVKLPDEPMPPAGKLDRAALEARLSPALRRQFAYAQSTQESRTRGLWGRELVTVALLAGGDDMTELLRASRTSLGRLRNDWYEWVTLRDEPRTRQQWDAWWAYAGVPLPGAAPESVAPTQGEERMPFDADIYTGKDLLGVEPAVNALAALIASHKTELPLAIGLFGEWGSGKSFFMRHLQKRIRRVTAAAEASGLGIGATAYWKRIAQIDFNAWHYSDGQIWPSLVQHIFENLRIGEEDDEGVLARRRDQILLRIGADEVAGRAADEHLAALRKQRVALEARIDELKAEQRQEQENLAKRLSAPVIANAVAASLSVAPAVRDDARKVLDEAGIEDLGRGAADLQAALRSASNEVRGLSGLLASLLHGAGRTRRVVLLLLVIVVPLAVGELLKWALGPQSGALATIAGLATKWSAFLGGLGLWVRDATGWMAGVRRRLAESTARVDDAIQREREALAGQQTAAMVQQLQTLEAKRAEEASATASRQRIDEQIEASRAELDRTTSTHRLNAFIAERAESTDYRKYLGITALVRRDFEKLSKLIARSNAAAEDPAKEKLALGSEHTINRIVLYIDDLDRCEESVVVDVLKAVHLLLALPLFVVVVAVDPRWLARCLKKRYPELLSENADGESADLPLPAATALDYLEKIFQIPVSLHPIGPDDRVRVVSALLEPKAVGTNGAGVALEAPVASGLRDASTSGSGPAVSALSGALSGSENGAAVTATRAEPPATGAPAAGASSHAPDAVIRAAHPRALEVPPVELDPRGLEVSAEERAFVRELDVLLSATPRVLKRFVNTYRLVKVGLPPRLRRSFVVPGETSPYRICMFELAILVGLPHAASVFLAEMQASPPRDSRTVGDWLMATRVDHPGWERVGRWLAERPEWLKLPLPLFAAWATVGARYTFHLSGPASASNAVDRSGEASESAAAPS
jgi:hypothetical protein